MPSPPLRPEGAFLVLWPSGGRSLVYSRFRTKIPDAYGSQEWAWMRAHNDTERSLIFSSTINNSILEYVHNRPPVARPPQPLVRNYTNRILGIRYCLFSVVMTACSTHAPKLKFPRLSQMRALAPRYTVACMHTACTR